MLRDIHQMARRDDTTALPAGELLAHRLLRRYLTWALVSLSLLQLAAWIPHYLTWPLWADHDVFATMAHAWDAGELPYRDFRTTNFPGTAYLFWVLGQTFGWGGSVTFYALDVVLLVTAGAALAVWSRRCLGTPLGGVVGYAALLTFYLNLDFTQTAQRDWHAALLAMGGLVAAQASPNLRGSFASAFFFAAAFLIRPHVVLFLPAIAWTVARPDGATRDQSAVRLRLGGWSAAVVIFITLGLLPLIRAGVLDDLIRSIPVFGYGHGSDPRPPADRAAVLISLLLTPKIIAVPAAMLFLAWRSGRLWFAAPWLLALMGTLLYDAVSPFSHPYLADPMWVVWSIQTGILAHLIVQDERSLPSLRLAAVVLLLSLSLVPKPRFCSLHASLRAADFLMRSQQPEVAPPGYLHNFASVPLYPWADYLAVLAHLRNVTPSQARVANLLHAVAVTGPTGRLSVFPAESATWLGMVAPEDEEMFAAALERAGDSVVVWDPSESRMRSRPRLLSTVLREYEPQARFGTIEIWRKK